MSFIRELSNSMQCVFYLYFCMGLSPPVCHSPGGRVVLGPYPYILIQVMRPQDGRVSSQVLKIVHDDSHKQIQHLEQVCRKHSDAKIFFKQ